MTEDISYPDPLNEPKMDSEPDKETMDELEDEIRNSEVVTSSAKRVEKPFIDYHRFGQFGKLLRVKGWVLWFIGHLRTPESQNFSQEISSDEMNEAKIALRKCIQR
ncbi:hypothetical protein ElyMa_003297500 [Elysia marginata]|uniref:Uncharacterized protein n=1 Tax=Elysia marginata TaxID=1093978 RepID=A0AAV4JAF3_9GAST|nr:hypothetical protein ElyMa_003297500 [Elysia marginata]